jgi:tetratricopeptide (TPR) repeat protein
MHIPANALVAVTLMALLTGYFRFVTDRYWFKARLGIKVPLTIVLIAASIFLTWQTVRSERASLWLIQAKRAPADSAEQIAALEKAFAADKGNAETARAIGEAFRQQSWQGIGDSEGQAHEAMNWFRQAIALNPYDDSSMLRYGMCLDRIFGSHDEAFEYFNRAIELDSNSYFNDAYMGWHFVQSGDYAAARPWFVRSRRLEWNENPIAETYLKLVNDRLLEAATNLSPVSLQ